MPPTNPARFNSDIDREDIRDKVERVAAGATEVSVVCQGDELDTASQTLVLPWSSRATSARKGVSYEPRTEDRLDAGARDALLAAIGRARAWVRELLEGEADSFDAIAQREGKGERHIRLLAPLAFVSPRIVAAIIDGTAPGGLTVTGLARALPLAWAAQKQRLGPD